MVTSKKANETLKQRGLSGFITILNYERGSYEHEHEAFFCFSKNCYLDHIV